MLKLSEIEQTFLKELLEKHTGQNPLPTFLMGKDEVKIAEKLVKLGLIVKGKAIEDARRNIYYADR